MDVKNWAGEARSRGVKNLNAILEWTYQWGWTTEAVAQRLLGVQRRVAAEYARKGYLLRIDPPRGHIAAYVVAQAHQTHAAALYEAKTGLAIPYPYPRSAVPFSALAEHQELAQLISLDELKDGDRLTVDREMRDGESAALPDIAIDRASGEVEWHEIELHAKYQERLIYQLQERHKALHNGEFDLCVWHCRTHGIARNLQAALCKSVLPRVVKRADGRICRLPGAEGWSPRRLRDKTDVRVIGASGIDAGQTIEQYELEMIPGI